MIFLRKSAACVDAHVEFTQIIFWRNCANCAKIRADLQLCAFKNNYFAPRIRAFRRLGTILICNPTDPVRRVPLHPFPYSPGDPGHPVPPPGGIARRVPTQAGGETGAKQDRRRRGGGHGRIPAIVIFFFI